MPENNHAAEVTALERLDPRRHRGRYVVDHYARYAFAAQFAAGRRVLDVACGYGYGSHVLRAAGAASVVGVDLSEEAIAYARAHYAADGIEYVVGNAQQLEQAVRGPFDLIVSFETIEHLSEPDRFRAACVSLASRDAALVFSVPNEMETPADNPFHLQQFDHDRFDAWIGSAFPVRRILPYHMSTSAVIGERSGHTVGPLWRAPASTFCVDDTVDHPDGFVAVCSRGAALPAIDAALVHSRRAFEEMESDRLWLESQRQAWMSTAARDEAAIRSVQASYDAAEAARQANARDADELRVYAASLERVIAEREQVLSEQEHVLQLQQAERKRLLAALRDVEAQLAGLPTASEHTDGAAEPTPADLIAARRELEAMRATMAWKTAERLRRLFPADSPHGRALRGTVRVLRKPFRRGAT